MKVSIYQRTPAGWELATEYYDWSVQFRPKHEDDPISGQVTCPGCGRHMARQYLRFDHMCPGTLTDKPLAVNRVNWQRVERKIAEARAKQYIQNARHRIVISY